MGIIFVITAGILLCILISVLLCKLSTTLYLKEYRTFPIANDLQPASAEEIQCFLHSYTLAGTSVYSKKMIQIKERMAQNLYVSYGTVTEVVESNNVDGDNKRITVTIVTGGISYCVTNMFSDQVQVNDPICTYYESEPNGMVFCYAKRQYE